MTNLKDKILSQTKAMKWWGQFRYIAQFISFYFLILTAVTASGTFFYTVIKPWLKTSFDIELGIWLFYIILLVGLLIVLVFEYKVTMPGWQSIWNKQWWQHDNPMRQMIEGWDKRQKETDKKIKRIEDKLDILIKDKGEQ